MVSRYPRQCMVRGVLLFSRGRFLTGLEQLLLPAPVVFGYGFVRFDAQSDDLFDNLPAFGVAGFPPEALHVGEQLLVDERIELSAAFSGTRRCHMDIAITGVVSGVLFPRRGGVSGR